MRGLHWTYDLTKPFCLEPCFLRGSPSKNLCFPSILPFSLKSMYVVWASYYLMLKYYWLFWSKKLSNMQSVGLGNLEIRGPHLKGVGVYVMKLQNKVLVLKWLSLPTLALDATIATYWKIKWKCHKFNRIEVSLRNFTLGLFGEHWMTSSLFRLNAWSWNFNKWLGKLNWIIVELLDEYFWRSLGLLMFVHQRESNLDPKD